MSGGRLRYDESTFLGSRTRLASWVGRPLRRFMEIEAAGGVVMLIATVVALTWANSPWQASYLALWATEIHVEIGGWVLGGGHHFTVGAVVNDALMAVFFFVVGMEIKRELVAGQLRDRRAAVLPAMAAVGGMVVPALVFVAFNLGGEGMNGWGIPMATDIAFAVGVLSLLGSRVPRTLKIFLLTLAIVDDIGAIVVIALFYTEQVSFGWLLVASSLLVAVRVLQRLRVWYVSVYVAVAIPLWVAMFESGVHATIAGVALGLLTPARPLVSLTEARPVVDWLQHKDSLQVVDVRYASWKLRETVSVAERLENALHPVTGFVIIPVFALANAGVVLSREAVSDAMSSPVTLGVALGLVGGKSLGVFGAAWLGSRSRFASRPPELTDLRLLGVSMVAGIGFTVALFVAGLAFETGSTLTADAKIGILAGSAVAAVLGALVLFRAKDAPRSGPSAGSRGSSTRGPEPVTVG